jgi:hypothetical protein
LSVPRANTVIPPPSLTTAGADVNEPPNERHDTHEFPSTDERYHNPSSAPRTNTSIRSPTVTDTGDDFAIPPRAIHPDHATPSPERPYHTEPSLPATNTNGPDAFAPTSISPRTYPPRPSHTNAAGSVGTNGSVAGPGIVVGAGSVVDVVGAGAGTVDDVGGGTVDDVGPGTVDDVGAGTVDDVGTGSVSADAGGARFAIPPSTAAARPTANHRNGRAKPDAMRRAPATGGDRHRDRRGVVPVDTAGGVALFSAVDETRQFLKPSTPNDHAASPRTRRADPNWANLMTHLRHLSEADRITPRAPETGPSLEWRAGRRTAVAIFSENGTRGASAAWAGHSPLVVGPPGGQRPDAIEVRASQLPPQISHVGSSPSPRAVSVSWYVHAALS